MQKYQNFEKSRNHYVCYEKPPTMIDSIDVDVEDLLHHRKGKRKRVANSSSRRKNMTNTNPTENRLDHNPLQLRHFSSQIKI